MDWTYLIELLREDTDFQLECTSCEQIIHIQLRDSNNVFATINRERTDNLTFEACDKSIEAIKKFIRSYRIQDYTYDLNVPYGFNHDLSCFRPFRFMEGLSPKRICSLNTPDIYQVIPISSYGTISGKVWLVNLDNNGLNDEDVMKLYKQQGVIFYESNYHGARYAYGRQISYIRFNELVREYYIAHHTVNILLANSTKSAMTVVPVNRTS